MNLSTYIKSRRENIGISQTALAKQIGVSRSTLIRYESGETEPTFTEFMKLCKILGMQIEDFITEGVEK